MLEQLKKKREEGFTLIELLIVIIILAILAAIVVFAVGSTANNAKVSSCNADAKSVETAVEAYKAQTGSFPTDVSSLTATQTNLITEANDTYTQTIGPWLRAVPNANTGNNGYAVTLNASGEVSIEDTAGVFVNYDAGGACAKA